MKTIVLSNLQQYEKFIHSGFDPKDFQIFCDNERFYDFLNQKKISFQKLDEFLLKDKWEIINTWGISQSAEWITIGRQNRFFESYDFPSVICLWFSVLLIMALKNYYLACRVLENQPKEICVFKGTSNDQYPLLSGNVGLNFLLEEVAKQKSISTHVIPLDQAKEALLSEKFGLKQKIRIGIKKSFEWIYGQIIRPGKKCDIFVFGTLRHLSSTMEELKRKKAEVYFYDDELRINHLKFCIKNKIPYFLPFCFKKSKNIRKADHLMDESLKALKHPASQKHFLYNQFDFKNYIQERIFSTMSRYTKHLLEEEANYWNIVSSCQIGGILVDEDFNAHSFFVEFMKKAGIPRFCVSHANLALDCVVDSSNRPFEQSHTFVQSEHERATYLERGWADREIVMTGIPRYDHSIRLTEKRSEFWKSNRNFRILHCTGFLWPASPDIPGYIGVDIYAYRYYQEQTVRAFIEAARGLPITFVLKPHYAEDEGMWRDFLKNEYPHDSAEVMPATRNYFEILLESDAMAIGLWTSTIIEAGIANLPVFYLDLENTDSDQIKRLEKSGLCKILRTQKALRLELEKLCQKRVMPPNHADLALSKEYYLGKLDAKATERVVEFMLKKIKTGSHV